MKKIKVVAALIKRKNKIFLCQRKENDCFGLLWEFPGGKVEKFEKLKDAIKREIKEELNLDIEPKRLVGRFSDKNNSSEILVYLFECRIVGGKPQRKECNDFGFFSFKDASLLDLAPIDKKILNSLLSKKLLKNERRTIKSIKERSTF